MGNNVSTYFSNVNSNPRNAPPPHPATVAGPRSFNNRSSPSDNTTRTNTAGRISSNVDSSAGVSNAASKNNVSARTGGGAASAIQAASEAASGVTSGFINTYNISGNANVTNNWYDNIHGNSGIFNGLGEYSGRIASAEQRAYERSNNWANTGKSVAGPVGQLAGWLLGKSMRTSFLDNELKNSNFKTLSTTDQTRIDPRDAVTSTVDSSKGHLTTDNKEYQNAAKSLNSPTSSSSSKSESMEMKDMSPPSYQQSATALNSTDSNSSSSSENIEMKNMPSSTSSNTPTVSQDPVPTKPGITPIGV